MATSFKDVMQQARAAANAQDSNADDKGQSSVVGSVIKDTPPAPKPIVPAATAQDNAELDALRRQLAEAKAAHDAHVAAADAAAEARAEQRAAEVRAAARAELGVDTMQEELNRYREASRNTEFETLVESLEGDADLDTPQLRSIATKMIPLLKKMEERTASRTDTKQVDALRQELDALKKHQADTSKASIQDRVSARAKDMGVNVDTLLDDDNYKRLLKERVPGSRQTHAQALYEMLQSGDVEDAATKLKDLQGMIKPDYAKQAATVKAGSAGNNNGASQDDDAPKDFNAIADDLYSRLRTGEMSRTDHGKQVHDNFKSLFAVGR
jgi:hypothetical protein